MSRLFFPALTTPTRGLPRVPPPRPRGPRRQARDFRGVKNGIFGASVRKKLGLSPRNAGVPGINSVCEPRVIGTVDGRGLQKVMVAVQGEVAAVAPE
jgi:hypothetical protein